MATAAAIVLALDANSRQSFDMFLLAVPVWLALAAVWSLRFAVSMARTRFRIPPRHWARWLAIPIAMGVVFFATRTDAVRDGRFALSRPALDVMAADVMAGGTTQRGWVGLYHVGEIERTANGFLFVVDEFLGRVGFAYSAAGTPEFAEQNYGGWTDPMFERVGPGWWFFAQGWD